jgi:TetR/AcrR family transcriptional regulator, regulator of autoinduction and epiphytic fitness
MTLATQAVSAPLKPSFRAKMLLAREEAIIDAVNRLLADKGFDLMTMDEVAAEVGIAKASLYKHYESKEALAAAAMAKTFAEAEDFIGSLDSVAEPVDRLKAVVRWTLRMQLAGRMPSLPSQNSTLRAALMGHKPYIDALMKVSDTLGGWIEAAQAKGQVSAAVPAVAVLYTLYSRACDPVLEFLRPTGLGSDDELIELVVRTCFDGLAAR